MGKKKAFVKPSPAEVSRRIKKDMQEHGSLFGGLGTLTRQVCILATVAILLYFFLPELHWIDEFLGGDEHEIDGSPEYTAFEGSPEESWRRVLEGDEAVVEHVQVTDWIPNEQGAFSLFLGGMPYILRNTPALEWPCMKKWSPEYIQSRISTLDRVHVGTGGNNVWQYDVPNPALKSSYFFSDEEERSLKEKSRAPFSSRSMATSEFFKRCADTKDQSTFVYYAGDMGGGEILKDVGNPQDLFMDSLREVVAPNSAPVYFAWLGKEGVAAHCHIDAMHNFFVHIRGRKRFVLFPPSLSEDTLFMYPKLHAGTGQSQIDFLNPDVEAFPEFFTDRVQERIRNAALVADLGPGDVLYLPPYWSHYVKAVESSISVSLWVQDITVDIASNLREIEFPLRSSWDDKIKATAAASFVLGAVEASMTSAAVSGSASADGTANTGVDSGRASHNEALAEIRLLLDGRYRRATLRAENEPDWLPSASSTILSSCTVEMEHSKASEELKELSQKAASLLRLIPDRHIRRGVLYDYIEELLSLVVDPERVFPVLRAISDLCTGAAGTVASSHASM